ncbi:MAG: hypothetical protein H0V34_14850 [Gammaproteobacteria bacterium]|nr:hypothetical protein [Gammaproteobacteria bacterium]
MHTDSQILILLAKCEAAAGRRLKEVRGNLKSKGWLPDSWQFHMLRIAKISDRYWLFENNRQEGIFSSAEEAAEIASSMYKPFPSHIFWPRRYPTES